MTLDAAPLDVAFLVFSIAGFLVAEYALRVARGLVHDLRVEIQERAQASPPGHVLRYDDHALLYAAIRTYHREQNRVFLQLVMVGIGLLLLWLPNGPVSDPEDLAAFAASALFMLLPLLSLKAGVTDLYEWTTLVGMVRHPAANREADHGTSP